MIPTLLGITLIVFVVMASAPGGISAQSLVEGQNLEPQAKKALEDYYNKLYGLDDPAPIQYLRWLNNVSPVGFVVKKNGEFGSFSFTKGSDLGRSFRTGRPVGALIAERVPITLLLNIVSIPIIYFIAISVGVTAATKRGGRFDVLSNMTMLGLWSVPTMLTGVLLIVFFASKRYWHWFPTAGLNEREAFDMPFLPHWQFGSDMLLVAASVATFAIVLCLLAGFRQQIRVGGLLVIALLGIWKLTVESDNSTGLMSSVLLFLLFATTAFLLARITKFTTRKYLYVLLGVVLGFVVGTSYGSGEFVRGFLLDRIWHLILPVLCLSYTGFAFLSRLMRSAVLENLQSDYSRTARAKGVDQVSVLWHHVFRNSLLPLITVSANLLPGLLAGSVIVESIFSIDGMGKLAVEAVQGRDRELVLSITLVSGVLTLLGYLIADICYSLADPRISYD